MPDSSTMLPRLSDGGLEGAQARLHAINSMLGLSSNDYLHSLPEKDVFARLIDCYRLRTGDVSISGLDGGANPLPDFKLLLNEAEKVKVSHQDDGTRRSGRSV
ncbi:MYND domain protein [Diplocarpon rosae]|nr:MYND domain protein [Diplocarpon rosae]